MWAFVKKIVTFSFLSRVEEILAGGDADVEDLDNDGQSLTLNANENIRASLT